MKSSLLSVFEKFGHVNHIPLSVLIILIDENIYKNHLPFCKYFAIIKEIIFIIVSILARSTTSTLDLVFLSVSLVIHNFFPLY